MKKLMMWLGLGPDEAYEGYDPHGDEPVLRGPLSSTEFAEARAVAETGGTVSPLHTRTPVSRSVRTLPAEPTGTVRPLQPAVVAKPTTVSPTSFNDVQQMADRFIRNYIPTIGCLFDMPSYIKLAAAVRLAPLFIAFMICLDQQDIIVNAITCSYSTISSTA